MPPVQVLLLSFLIQDVGSVFPDNKKRFPVQKDHPVFLEDIIIRRDAGPVIPGIDHRQGLLYLFHGLCFEDLVAAGAVIILHHHGAVQRQHVSADMVHVILTKSRRGNVVRQENMFHRRDPAVIEDLVRQHLILAEFLDGSRIQRELIAQDVTGPAVFSEPVSPSVGKTVERDALFPADIF